MPRAIALRPDFVAIALRRLARLSKDAAQARRLLALASIYDGGTRSEAARLGNVTLQSVRDWVLRFNAEGPAGLIDRKAPGPTPLLTAAHRQALAAQIDRGPIPAIHGVVRWRLCDLGQWLWPMAVANGCGQWLWPMAVANGCGRSSTSRSRPRR